jgi:hypothetical protein
MARRVESAEAHRIQYPQSLLKSVMASLAVDSNGERIGGLKRRMDRHEQKWPRAKGFLTAAGVAIARLEVVAETRRWH